MEIYKRPIPLDKGSTSQVRGHEQRSQGQCLAHRSGQMTGNAPLDRQLSFSVSALAAGSAVITVAD